MITQTDAQIKEIVNGVIDLATGLSEQATDPDLVMDRDAIKAEWMTLCIYVAGADKNISQEEIELLNFMFDYNLSPYDINNLIGQVSGMYGRITTQPGLSFTILNALDQMTGGHNGCEMYISAVETVLNRFAGIDGNVDPSETQFINNYVAMLRRNM